MLGFSLRAFGRTCSLALAATVLVGAVVPPGAMAATTQVASEQITGRVGHTAGYWDDAQISAVAFAFDSTANAWDAVANADVAADGTYTIELPSSGTYRVGYFDASLVYADSFFANASKVESATPISVAAGQTVTSVDQTVTALPEYIIEGKVAYTGETTPDAGVGVTVYTYDATAGANALVTRRTRPDGTYRIHLPAVDVANGYTGTYRLGFTDFDDVFAPTFYGASTVESATPLVVNTPGTVRSSIDVTMAAQPSNKIIGKDAYDLSIKLSQRFDAGSGVPVVLANASSWRDMLVAAPYSHSLGGPLLATGKSWVPSNIRSEITRLAPSQVVIVGGPSSVSVAEEIQLRGMGVPVVRRVWGASSSDTAAQVASEMVNSGVADGSMVAVAPYETAVPSVAAASVAVAGDVPIVFTTKNKVPASTAAFVRRVNPGTSLLFGGTSYISSATASKFPGATRFNSNVAAGIGTKGSAYGIASLELSGRLIGLVPSSRPVDAFLADTYFGSKRVTAVSTGKTKLDPTTAAYLTANKAQFARVIGVGSGTPFYSNVFNAAAAAVQ